MSRRPFDPNELDEPASDADWAIGELERYTLGTDVDEPHGLSDRIMASIEHEPTPRRGLLVWLTTSAPARGPGRFVRVAAVGATLVLVVAGALFAGQLVDLVRDVGGNGTPTPTVSPSPTESQPSSPSPSIEPRPSATPEGSDDHGGNVPTAQPTPQDTPNGTPADTPEESKTPRPSPTATASPTATPQQSSGG